jgi:hypothetical protein
VIGALAILEVFEDVDDGAAQFMSVVLVLLVLGTSLAPIVRRLQGPAAPERRAQPGGSASLAAEVGAVADRLEELAGGAHPEAEAIEREGRRLRELAARLSNEEH